LVANLILSFFDPEQVMVKSYDEDYLFIMYPNKEGEVVSEEYKTNVLTNDFGFRQKLLPDEIFDTLILGDSFTEGWGVDESESFVSVANESLPNGNKIRNLGIHGASPAFYALQLEKHIENFKPKKVFIQLFDNDLDDNDKLTVFMKVADNRSILGPKPNISVKILGETLSNGIKESTLYRLGKRISAAINKQPNTILYYKPGKAPKIELISHEESIQKYGSIQPLGDEISSKYGGQFEFYSDINPELWKKRLDNNLIYLNQIFEICQSKNVELSLIYIPAKEFYAKDGITGKLLNSSLSKKLEINPHSRQITSFCEKNRLTCYNTTEIFYSKNPNEIYFPYDAHWNTKGHRIFGNFLSDSLKKEYR
jgi:hypothetical protein